MVIAPGRITAIAYRHIVKTVVVLFKNWFVFVLQYQKYDMGVNGLKISSIWWENPEFSNFDLFVILYD